MPRNRIALPARSARARRARLLAVAVAALLGCSQPALSPPGGSDLAAVAAPADLAAPPRDMAAAAPDLASFCGNPNSARVALNSMLAESPAVMGVPLYLNCCDAAYFDVISMQISTEITVMWRHQVGQGPDLPVTLDLAHLPAGWSVAVSSGCRPGQPNCQATDRYDSGFTGTLTIERGGGGYRMSTCLEVDELPANPHPVIHSLRLWSPTVNAP